MSHPASVRTSEAVPRLGVTDPHGLSVSQCVQGFRFEVVILIFFLGAAVLVFTQLLPSEFLVDLQIPN